MRSHEPPQAPMTTATTHNHGRHRQQWALRLSQEALRPTPTPLLDRGSHPKQADINFVGGEGECSPQTLQCCSDSSSPEQRIVLMLRVIDLLNPPKAYWFAQGDVPNQSNALALEIGPPVGH